jgi:hypothetical protein
MAPTLEEEQSSGPGRSSPLRRGALARRGRRALRTERDDLTVEHQAPPPSPLSRSRRPSASIGGATYLAVGRFPLPDTSPIGVSRGIRARLQTANPPNRPAFPGCKLVPDSAIPATVVACRASTQAREPRGCPLLPFRSSIGDYLCEKTLNRRARPRRRRGLRVHGAPSQLPLARARLGRRRRLESGCVSLRTRGASARVEPPVGLAGPGRPVGDKQGRGRRRLHSSRCTLGENHQAPHAGRPSSRLVSRMTRRAPDQAERVARRRYARV